MKETTQTLVMTFTIIALGYVLGSVRFKGIKLGTAAIFLVGLLFGHFGITLPGVLQTLGLVFFITPVGFSAGPTFVRRLKMSGKAYAVLCVTIACVGSLICIGVIKLGGVESSLAVGIMTGAFTTSPGFAAAKEAVSASASAVSRVAAGYGVAYPVGVVCKVLAVQMIPRWVHADMAHERELIALPANHAKEAVNAGKKLDTWGLMPFAAAVVLGMVLGSLTITLPGGGHFSLGTAGGPLIVGLLIGHIGHIGNIDLRPDPKLYGPTKEIGMMLFFAGAGVEGGRDLAEILSTYGLSLLLYAFLLVAIPLAAGFFMFRYVLKLPLLNGLGSITASMTSTPSLAELIQVAGTDDVAAAYATTYPIALITLILMCQVLVSL